jgi:hypothetical protein
MWNSPFKKIIEFHLHRTLVLQGWKKGSFKLKFNKDIWSLLQIYDHHRKIISYNVVKKMT